MPITKERLGEIITALRKTYDTLEIIERRALEIAVASDETNALRNLQNFQAEIAQWTRDLPRAIPFILGREESHRKNNFKKNERTKRYQQMVRIGLKRPIPHLSTGPTKTQMELTDLAPIKHKREFVPEPAISVDEKRQAAKEKLDNVLTELDLKRLIDEASTEPESEPDVTPDLEPLVERTEKDGIITIKTDETIHTFKKGDEMDETPSRDTPLFGKE